MYNPNDRYCMELFVDYAVLSVGLHNKSDTHRWIVSPVFNFSDAIFH